ncbi:MAG: cupin domain-containing protein [Gammaproteobacteria bacterium]|nr:cupin domain-containing protein [Gammaproteobacteria bacterium]
MHVTSPTNDLQAIFDFYQAQRKNPPEIFSHRSGLLPVPDFFSVAALQQHLNNPLLGTDWVQLRAKNQAVSLEGYCHWKMVQTKKLLFVDKQLINEKLKQWASIVLEGLDILDANINAFAAKLDAELPCALVNSVAFFSQKDNEAYGGHRDSDDVLVIHVSGEKLWKIYAPQQRRYFNNSPLTVQQMGPLHKEIIMRPGDALYLRAGVPHMCQTTGDHSLHIAFDLCDRTPNIDQITHEANTRYNNGCEIPNVPAAKVVDKYIELLKSPDFRRDMETATQQIRSNAISFRQKISRTAGINALSRFIPETKS